jgi:hypothetical protein
MFLLFGRKKSKNESKEKKPLYVEIYEERLFLCYAYEKEGKAKPRQVDWSGGCSTPAGEAGKLRPHRAKPEEAQLTPRGKRAPGAEIN